jgi:hypothetical protein
VFGVIKCIFSVYLVRGNCLFIFSFLITIFLLFFQGIISSLMVKLIETFAVFCKSQVVCSFLSSFFCTSSQLYIFYMRIFSCGFCFFFVLLICFLFFLSLESCL